MSPEIEHALKNDGRRLTHQRRRIVRELERAGGLITAEQVYYRIKREHPQMGLSTVYRTLELLVRLRVAYTRSFGEGHRLYELYAADQPRQHARCRACGAVIEFDEALSDYLALQVERDSGFVTHSFELTLHGRCSYCAAGSLEPGVTPP